MPKAYSSNRPYNRPEIVWRDEMDAVEVHDRQGDRVDRVSVRAWVVQRAARPGTNPPKTHTRKERGGTSITPEITFPSITSYK
jgi:hypothetical protein